MSYCRFDHTHATLVNADDVESWVDILEHHGHARSFFLACTLIGKRKERLCVIAANSLVKSYKFGHPFPSHFIWEKREYTLPEPEALERLTRVEKKRHHVLEGAL